MFSRQLFALGCSDTLHTRVMSGNRAASITRIIADPASKHVKAGTSQKVTTGDVTVGLNGSVSIQQWAMYIGLSSSSFIRA